MTDLTEQLNKGELKEGAYYVLYYKNDIDEVDIYRRVYSLYDDSEVKFTIPQVTEVLAPVPSYEEWQAKLEENTKLKELLKECREPLEVLADKRNACDWCPEDLLAKINQTLGEDK